VRTNTVHTVIAILLLCVLTLSLSSPIRADTRAERRYVSTMTVKMRRIGATIIAFSDLIQHPNRGDEAWTENFDACCVKLRSSPAEIRGIAVPQRFKTAHKHLEDALVGYSYIGYHLPGAISSQDRQEGAKCFKVMDKADREFGLAQSAYSAAGLRD